MSTWAPTEESVSDAHFLRDIRRFHRDELKQILEEWTGSTLPSTVQKGALVSHALELKETRQNISFDLALLDIRYMSLRCDQKTWSVLRLGPSTGAANVQEAVIQRRLVKSLLMYFQNAEVHVQIKDDLLWVRVSIDGETHSLKDQTVAPDRVFFVHRPFTPFVFHSPLKAALKPFLLDALQSCFSCSSVTPHSLKGKKISEMLELATKKSVSTKGSILALDPQPQQRVPRQMKRSQVIEEEKGKKRKVAALKAFGGGKVPVLEKIELSVTKTAVHSKLDEDVKMKIVLSGPNVLEGFRDCIRHGLAPERVPNILEKVMESGANKITELHGHITARNEFLGAL